MIRKAKKPKRSKLSDEEKQKIRVRDKATVKAGLQAVTPGGLEKDVVDQVNKQEDHPKHEKYPL